MSKRFVLLIGVLLGVLIAEMFHRPKLKRLATLEANEASMRENLAEYDRQWREEVAALPFEERMKVELWEAGMRLNNWMPDDTPSWEEDDDEETS